MSLHYIFIGNTTQQFGMFGDMLIFLMFFGFYMIMSTMFVKKDKVEDKAESESEDIPEPRHIDLFGDDMEDM